MNSGDVIDAWMDNYKGGIEFNYAKTNKKSTYYQNMYKPKSLEIKHVIFNEPATIVIWSDEVKTVVKCSKHDVFDPEKGLAMAIVKRFMGNTRIVQKHAEKYYANKEEVDNAWYEAISRFFGVSFTNEE